MPKVLEILSPGVMEYWGVEKRDINSLVITPTLQYSNTPKLIEIESCHDGLASFDLYIRCFSLGAPLIVKNHGAIDQLRQQIINN